MSHWGIAEATATAFAALTASAFLFTTLDSATRLGRYAVQELTEQRVPVLAKNIHLSTLIVLIGAGGLALTGTWNAVWPLFGSANQMLGAIALLAVSVWLIKKGVKSYFIVIPMVFMFVVTISALLVLMQQNFTEGNYFLAISATFLFVLCIFLIIEAWRSLIGTKDKDITVKAE
jgi:carbon starvation protein